MSASVYIRSSSAVHSNQSRRQGAGAGTNGCSDHSATRACSAPVYIAYCCVVGEVDTGSNGSLPTPCIQPLQAGRIAVRPAPVCHAATGPPPPFCGRIDSCSCATATVSLSMACRLTLAGASTRTAAIGRRPDDRHSSCDASATSSVTSTSTGVAAPVAADTSDTVVYTV